MLAGGSRGPGSVPQTTRDAMESIANDIVSTFGTIGSIFVEAQVNRAEYALVSSLIRDYASDADIEATCARIASVAMTLLGGDYAIISRHEPNLSHTYHGRAIDTQQLVETRHAFRYAAYAGSRRTSRRGPKS